MGISFEVHTELIIIDGASITADCYMTEIFEKHVVFYAPFVIIL